MEHPLNNIDPRRRNELADARMIQEDHSAIANLSGTVINKQFDPWRSFHNPWADDEVTGK